jgi:hypothetical protein
MQPGYTKKWLTNQRLGPGPGRLLLNFGNKSQETNSVKNYASERASD